MLRSPVLSVCSLVVGCALLHTTPAAAATGDVLASFDWVADDFIADPSRPRVYASLTDRNAVAIIDTTTLEATTVFVGSAPRGLAISPDGGRLYVANSGSNFIAVLDTATDTLLAPIAVPDPPRDLAIGSGNRLFALAGTRVLQLDRTTGESAGGDIGPDGMGYSGTLQASPDGNTLYYGDYYLSPSSLFKFDVTDPTSPTLLWESTHGGSGSNGQDLTLSNDGTLIAYPNGAPYIIPIRRTSDMLTVGFLGTGAYPRELAFSPDGRLAYAVNDDGEIKIFDATTFLQTGTILGDGQASELSVDPTGRYLFASRNGALNYDAGDLGTTIYDTGVPEPASATLLLIGAALMRRRR